MKRLTSLLAVAAIAIVISGCCTKGSGLRARMMGGCGDVPENCASCNSCNTCDTGCKSGLLSKLGCGTRGCQQAAPQQMGMAGPPVGAYAYPYYTVRGPRDFLLDNPPPIGP